MKHSYKFFMIFFSLILLAACGNNSDEDNTDTAENSGEETTTDDSGETADNTDEGDTETSDDSASNSEDSDSSSTSPDGNSDTISLDDIVEDPADAISMAQENFDGDLTSLELDNDNNTWVYEIDMESDEEDYELQLAVEDLSVVSENQEQDNNINIEGFNYEDAVPYDEAVQTAIDEVDGDLEGFSLEIDNGQLEYEIELDNTSQDDDMDVVINAETGEITETDD